jgi:hypothetical protein
MMPPPFSMFSPAGAEENQPLFIPIAEARGFSAAFVNWGNKGKMQQ